MKKMILQKTISVGVLMLMFIYSQAQRALPDMYIDRDDAVERKASFIVKSQFLSNDLGIETKDSLFFPINSFRNMISHFNKLGKAPVGLRIYFAQYPETSSAQVPDAWVNQLTILFSPIIPGTANPGIYFINDHGDFDENDNKLPDTSWITRYQTNMLKTLNKTINKGDRENYSDPKKPQTFSDTKRIDYCGPAVAQFVDEIRYQDSVHNDDNFITGIRCYFSSYSKTGILLDNGLRKYRKRLIVQFAFTTKNEEVYDIDTAGRIHVPKACPLIEKVAEDFLSGYDNGQLCPANCP